MADLVQLQAWLSDAELARHKLLTGSLRQTVRYNGTQEVQFAQTDIAKLNEYIASLRAQIAAADGSVQQIRRPIYLGF